VAGATAFNRVLFTDGLIYRTYDVLEAAATPITEWVATKGRIPPRGRLLCIWNGAAVLAGFENEPHNWAKSAGDDLDDWDFFPPVQTVTQAIVGNNSDAGQCPDIITTLIPWSDDLLIMGGDHSIHRLTGDPAAGGVIDRVTDITGMAWGTAWCKDPQGRIWFIGAQGGFFVMHPAAVPEEITVEALSRRFQDLNIGLGSTGNKIQLVWNDQDKGVHVFITPFTNTTQTTHYFWDALNRAWWPDKFAYSDAGAFKHNPLAVWIADGDAPGDRVILKGDQDGYVRKWDAAAKGDDGTAIDSYVFIGPIQAGGRDREFKMNNIRCVLAADVEDATLNAYGVESADFNLVTAGSPDVTATVSAGRNNGIFDRVRGNAVYFRIRNATLARRWALESLSGRIMAGGRARNR
jgi:hypothetical protein